MSTNYKFVEPVLFKTVKGRVESLGLFISDSKDADESSFCITNGDAYLWCYDLIDNTEFIRYGANDVEEILELLADTFGSDIISEHDEGYFGDENEEDEANEE